MLRLGTVTYNIAKDWDLPTLLERLEALGFEGVELRTTHKHGVEPSLSPIQRQEVKNRFDDSPVELVGLGSVFEFHSADRAELRKNIEGTKEFVKLAHDIGGSGVKVRPNGVPQGADRDATFRQIAESLDEVGEFAEGFGVAIRLEVHGAITSEVPNVARIMSFVPRSNVVVCWNSNPGDVVNGSISDNFALVANRIGMVHLRDLTDHKYPWRELFASLVKIGYEGFTLAEIPESSDPDRVLRYFRALWLAYQPIPE
jgi:sugar phosphate isomerase/epimerase